jgi:PD-(D/E)XK endonuclease
MGDELVRAADGAVGECGDAGGVKQIPRLWLGMSEIGMSESGGTGWVGLTRKQRGEMAEAAFLAKATSLGLRVSKPWGETRYDLIVDNGKKLLRVQVKSAHRAGRYGEYTFHARGCSLRVYNASEIDLLVAYIVPENAWYLFPVEEFLKYKSMKLYPVRWRKASKFEKFREAWGIVR